VFVERLWRSVKYEEVYLNAYDSVTQARQSLKKRIIYYNQQRKHQTLKATSTASLCIKVIFSLYPTPLIVNIQYG